MEKPGEYDVVHPIWQRGRDWGIQEERKRIIALLLDDANGYDAMNNAVECIDEGESLIALIEGQK